MRIGYVPNSSNLGHPADRRRVVYWAKSRGHEIVLDLESKYDVLLLSSRADLTAKTQETNRYPIILDLVDGYLGDEHLGEIGFVELAKSLLVMIRGVHVLIGKLLVKLAN